MGYNRDFEYWPQSKQSVQDSQFDLIQAQITEHKVTKEQCLVLCKQIDTDNLHWVLTQNLRQKI